MRRLQGGGGGGLAGARGAGSPHGSLRGLPGGRGFLGRVPGMSAGGGSPENLLGPAPLTLALMVAGFLPVAGEVIDVTELITGRDLATGEKLSSGERVLTAVAMFLPFVSASLVLRMWRWLGGTDEACEGA